MMYRALGKGVSGVLKLENIARKDLRLHHGPSRTSHQPMKSWGTRPQLAIGKCSLEVTRYKRVISLMESFFGFVVQNSSF
jgi:hypothetical protein